MDLFSFLPGYSQYIFDSGREPVFVMLLSFLLAFMAARGYTRLARVRGWGSVSLSGVHTHHLVFGVVLVLLSGALQIGFAPAADISQLLLASLFGIGAALILDEFALLFYLKDVYWQREGRKSVDAIIIATVLGALLLLHAAPLGGSGANAPHALFTASQMVNMIFVIIAAIKGKVWIAGLGVFVPILAIIGALRLAEPTSLWSKTFYRASLMKRSKARYAAYDRRWAPRKEKLLDVIGGKINA